MSEQAALHMGPLDQWAIEVHIENFNTGEMTILDAGAVHWPEVLALAKISACFRWNGLQCHSTAQPIADIVNRKIVYRCGGYPDG